MPFLMRGRPGSACSQLQAAQARGRPQPFIVENASREKAPRSRFAANRAWGIGGLDAAVEGLKTSGVSPLSVHPEGQLPIFGTAAGARSFTGAQ
jgi:hypothetical protein